MSDGGGIIGGVGDGLKDMVSEGAKQLAQGATAILSQAPKQIISKTETEQEAHDTQQKLAAVRARLSSINSLEASSTQQQEAQGPQIGEERPQLQPFGTSSLHEPNIVSQRAMTKRETKAGQGIGG